WSTTAPSSPIRETPSIAQAWWSSARAPTSRCWTVRSRSSGPAPGTCMPATAGAWRARPARSALSYPISIRWRTATTSRHRRVGYSMGGSPWLGTACGSLFLLGQPQDLDEPGHPGRLFHVLHFVIDGDQVRDHADED